MTGQSHSSHNFKIDSLKKMKIKQTNVFNSEILKLYFGFLPEELSFIGVSTHT